MWFAEENETTSKQSQAQTEPVKSQSTRPKRAAAEKPVSYK